MKRLLLSIVLVGACARPLLAQTHALIRRTLRYYDATNAITASQLLGVPMPLVKAKPGDWRLTLSPAYNRVQAPPIKFTGGSVQVGYSRRLSGRWGLYAVGLSNYVRTDPTSASGTPEARLLVPFFFGYDGPMAYTGNFYSGGSILTAGESLGAAYTIWAEREDRPTATIFGGLAAGQAFARDLRYDYRFTGSYGGGATSFRLDGDVYSKLDVYFYGAVLGVVSELDLGKHWRIMPHIYEVVLFASRQRGQMIVRETQRENGAVVSNTTRVFTTSDPVGQVYFPIPGVDVIYRDWSLGVNLVDLFGSVIARTTARDFLHDSWPFTLRVSKQFGHFDK